MPQSVTVNSTDDPTLVRGWPLFLQIVVVLAICWGTAISVAYHFSRHQSLWFDEVSHMCGVELSPGEVARWLQGERPNRFLVPADRNPPLSYWAGQTWTTLFDKGEFSLRAMGMAFLAASISVMIRGGWHIGNCWTAALAGLLFGLSPNVLDSAIEIRSYGVWLCLACLSWYQLLRIVTALDAPRSRFVLLAIICLAASYTHFFGVVQSACMLFVAAMYVIRSHRPMWRWGVVAIVLYAIGIIGLIPYIRWAITHVAGAEAELDPLTTGFGYGLQRMVYRLVGHPAASVYSPVLGSLVLGYGLAICAALVPLRCVMAARSENDHSHPSLGGGSDWMTQRKRVAIVIAITLLLGLSCNIAGRMVVTSFDPLRSRYSLWMLPGVMLLAVTGVSLGASHLLKLRLVSRLSACLLLVGTLATAFVLAQNVDFFTHGPHRLLVEQLRTDPRPIVIYEPSRVWGFGFVPLLYEFGEELGQYRAIENKPATRDEPANIELTHLRGPVLNTTPAGAPAGTRILVVRLEAFGQRELRQAIRDGAYPLADGPVLTDFQHQAGWKVLSEISFTSYTACRAVLLERTADHLRLPTGQSGEDQSLPK